jgi:hypothetical protein
MESRASASTVASEWAQARWYAAHPHRLSENNPYRHGHFHDAAITAVDAVMGAAIAGLGTALLPDGDKDRPTNGSATDPGHVPPQRPLHRFRHQGR